MRLESQVGWFGMQYIVRLVLCTLQEENVII